MRRFALLSILLIAGCKKSKEAQCDELAKMGIAIADGLGKQLGAKDSNIGADPEIKAKMAELKQQCMTWPDEVFECMRANDETSPKCREAMQHVTGVVETDSASLSDGPKIVASAKLGDVDSDGLATSLSADGTLVAATKKWITSVDATGTERWRKELDNAGWLVTLGDGSLLVGDRDAKEIVALDPKTGDPRWRAPTPDASDEYSSASMEAAVRAGANAVVALSDGRFLRVDPAACAKKAKDCVKVAFELADESLYSPELLAIGDDIVVGENELIRRFSPTGEVRAHIALRDTIGGMALIEGTRVAITMDDELVLWDLDRCSTSPVVLSRKRGRMYMKGEGDCADCSPPPAGCLAKRVELDDVESDQPVVMKDGSVVVTNFDGPALVGTNGVKRWNARIDTIGAIRQVGGALVFVSRDETESKPPRVTAIDAATGKGKWKRAFTAGDSDISYRTQAFVETAGPWVVAGAKGNVVWLEP
jgi:outer membrane protein assembly factor BamB